jgi:two-component system LytT family response regulator
MTIRCISIDDESLARQGLRLALKPFPDFELVGEYDCADQVLSNQPENIDVMFIDIEMPRLNGFELLKKWHGAVPLVVFITAYDQYAVKAFEEQALDYLLKPIDESRFFQVVDRIRANKALMKSHDETEKLLKLVEKLKAQDSHKDYAVSVKTTEGYFRIKLADILFLESVGDHVCLHLHDRQIITRHTLKKFIVELEENGFYQIHKSFLLNGAHIKQVSKLRFGDYLAVLSNDVELRISRRYRANLQEILAAKSS